MPFFDAKPRSWESYLAGIGASGALMASAFVLFVILVGLVTFSAWPHPGSLFGDDGGGDVALREIATPPPAQPTAQAGGLNLVKLLGAGAGRGTAGSPNQRGVHGAGSADGLIPGDGPGTSGPRGGQPQGGEQAPPSAPSRSNVVSQAVSGAGNTLQSDTDSLGDTLGGSSSPGLGGVVGGLGKTLNNTLQGLAGNH